MKRLQIGSMLAATAIMIVCPVGKSSSAKPNVAVEAEISPEMARPLALSVEANHSSQNDSISLSEDRENSHGAQAPQTNHSDTTRRIA